MNPSITQQAANSAAQGQQLLSNDQSQAAIGQSNYNNYSSQANQAAQQEQAQASYMQGAGSGQNVYNSQLQNLQNTYDPNLQGQLSNANQSLFSLTGALNGANQQFNTPGGVGAYGLSAPALAGYEGSILQPLQTGVSNANTQVNTLNSQLGTLMGGANQATTAQVQSEQQVATALNQAASSYQSQAAAALQNMQFYSQLASTQGGLNATNAQAYAQAQQGYADAQNALAQIQTYSAQAAQANAMAKYYASQVLNTGAGGTTTTAKAATQPGISLQNTVPTSTVQSTATPHQSSNVSSLLQPSGFSNGAGVLQ